MKNIFFGLATQYDQGSIPSVALNDKGTVLEVHKNQAGFKLYCRVGKLNKASVTWETVKSQEYDDGNEPQCALNASNVAVEVHKNEVGSTLYYHVGKVTGGAVKWGKSVEYDRGITPAVALNDAGVVAEVHQSQGNSGLYCHVGRVSGERIAWGDSQKFDHGRDPKVAIDRSGAVVAVFHSEGAGGLCYRLGRVNGNKIEFGASQHFASGSSPSVALTDAGYVIAAWQSGGSLVQRVGRLEGDHIAWQGEGLQFDSGSAPSVAAAGNMAIQVHPSEGILYGLWYSTSLLTTRASWMQERLGVLGSRPLADLVLPASHDSGMYKDGIAVLGKTQDLSIRGQLENGVRYFDLRPKWKGGRFVIYHGVIDGPELSEVLEDIAAFANEGHRELMILKLSHFDGIDEALYGSLTDQISEKLGQWLVTTRPAGKRLAEMTLDEYVGRGPAILIAIDGKYAVVQPKSGFWVYRDWCSDTAAEGDLRVFDQYSDMTNFGNMEASQLEKFAAYTGKCKDPSIPCDLFLLSWTLTPVTGVWIASDAPNRALGQSMAALKVPNRYGKIVNLLYVDYEEFARVTDVALFQNGAPAEAP